MNTLTDDECYDMFLKKNGLVDTIKLIYKAGYDERSEELDANTDGTESDVESGISEDSPVEETSETTKLEEVNEETILGLLHVDSAAVGGDVVREEFEGGSDNREGSDDRVDELERDTSGLG